MTAAYYATSHLHSRHACSDLSAVGCVCELWSSHCLLTFGLLIQVLPVNYHLAAALQSCLDCAVAVLGRTTHKHMLTKLVNISHGFRALGPKIVQLLLAVAMSHRLQCS